MVATSCGDNAFPVGAPLVHARDLTIVAHSDDDLVFMQPDVPAAVRRGGATNIYIADGSDAAPGRHTGLMAAYSAVTNSDNWACGFIELAGHAVEHCRLEAAHLSLVFLGYPEADFAGESSTSLRKLWDGSLAQAQTIGSISTTYDRAALITTLAAAIDATQPRTILTLEIGNTHGAEHFDHVITGALVVAATAASDQHPELVAFRGDSTVLEPANVIAPLYQRAANFLGLFDACATECGVCGEEACAIAGDRAGSLQHRYAVATRRVASGQLRQGGQCVIAKPGGILALDDCANATEPWELAADGTLHVGTRCLSAVAELIADGVCEPDAAHRFFLDDEGHIWLGVPPPATPGLAGTVRCLVVEDGRPRDGVCGPDGAPVWELSPAPSTTPRPAGLASTGRAVRLADLDGDDHADLCAVEAGKLECARGDGMGGFAPTTVIHALAVEPESLVIGDVDGDGSPDACGRDASGLLCATAAAGFVPERWTPAFAHAGPADATDRSLTAVDSDGNGTAEICGLAVDGVVCAGHDLVSLPVVRSTWPARTTTLWAGDLDGDRHADWCAGTQADGTACGLDSLRLLTTDGVPWSWSQTGVIEPAPESTAIGALGDIDGDGRADLCMAWNRRIACARSQSFAFGPSLTLAELPPGPPLAVLWLGDLDGDGTADACVEDAATITCVRAR